MNFLFVSLYDLGDQILLKIQSSWNRFKSNGSVGHIVTNPTQLTWVQTDVGSERYRVLFKMANMQKRDVDCTVRTDDDVAGRMDDVVGHMLMWHIVIGQLACDMVCWQRMEQ